MTPLVRKNHVNTYAKAWLTETIVNEIEEECKKHNIEVHNHIDDNVMRHNKEYNDLVHTILQSHLPKGVKVFSTSANNKTYIVSFPGNDFDHITEFIQKHSECNNIDIQSLTQSNFSIDEIKKTLDIFKSLIGITSTQRWNKIIEKKWSIYIPELNRKLFEIGYIEINRYVFKQRFEVFNIFQKLALTNHTLSSSKLAKEMAEHLNVVAGSTITTWVNKGN